MAKAPLSKRISAAFHILRTKDFIPPLSQFDGFSLGGGRLNNFTDKRSQLEANVGWCYTANTAIVDPTAAVELKLVRKMKDGDTEDVTDGPAMEIMELLDSPNLMHTGEQLRQLHFTYMNFVGESYIHMRSGADDFEPAKGKLPDALEIFPAHEVTLKLGSTYTSSIVKYAEHDYPLTSFVRDLNPDPEKPYFGRSVIKATALTIDTDNQMKQWNRGVFANGAKPGMVYTTNEPLSDAVYERLKQQLDDEHTGSDNSFKNLIVEGGDADPYMMNPQDLDFLESRKFSKDEILAMWKVSPGILGMTENVNRANLDAAFYLHAYINVLPRIRQFVRQLNVTLVKVFDPTLELTFVNPVPEDVEAKLKAVSAGVDKWWTKDEARALYGDDALPNKLGETIYMPNNNAPLESIADGSAKPTPTPPTPPAAEPAEPASKSQSGVKKKT